MPFDPRDKGHQNPAKIDFNEPRRAQYLHSAWTHQDAVFWVDIILAIREGLTFYQTRSNAIILQETLPASCIPKSSEIEDWRSLFFEKSYMSPRPPPKISLRHDHDWTRGKVQLGSTVDQQPESNIVRKSRGEVQHATFFQLTQPKPKPVIDQGKLRRCKMCLLLKVKRPVPMRSMTKVFTKNSVFEIDQGNLRSRLVGLKLVICLKIPVLSKLTMDQGNLMSVTA